MATPRQTRSRAGSRPGLWLAALLLPAACADWFAPPLLEARPQAPVGGAYERGRDHLSAGRFGLAVREFRAALGREPGSIEALNGLGAAYDRIGRHDLAGRSYGRALVLDPRSAQTLNNLGYSYLIQGKPDLAAAFLRDAQARAGADPVIAANRGAAETALARAGGPPARRVARLAAPSYSRAGARFKPFIARTAPGVHVLYTRPPALVRAPSPEAARPGSGPGVDRAVPAWAWPAEFLAAPMAGPGSPRAGPRAAPAERAPVDLLRDVPAAPLALTNAPGEARG